MVYATVSTIYVINIYQQYSERKHILFSLLKEDFLGTISDKVGRFLINYQSAFETTNLCISMSIYINIDIYYINSYM